MAMPCGYYYSSIEVSDGDISSTVVIAQIVLATTGHFYFHMSFEIIIFNFCEKLRLDFEGITFNLDVVFGRMFISQY